MEDTDELDEQAEQAPAGLARAKKLLDALVSRGGPEDPNERMKLCNLGLLHVPPRDDLTTEELRLRVRFQELREEARKALAQGNGVGDARPNPAPVTKRCTKCGVDKPLSEFGKRACRPDGKHQQCFSCLAVYQRELWRKRHPKTEGRKRHPKTEDSSAPVAAAPNSPATEEAEPEQSAGVIQEIGTPSPKLLVLACHAGYAIRLAANCGNEKLEDGIEHHLACAGALWAVMLSMMPEQSAGTAASLFLAGIRAALEDE